MRDMKVGEVTEGDPEQPRVVRVRVHPATILRCKVTHRRAVIVRLSQVKRKQREVDQVLRDLDSIQNGIGGPGV